jgi:hypothetical protein
MLIYDYEISTPQDMCASTQWMLIYNYEISTPQDMNVSTQWMLIYDYETPQDMYMYVNIWLWDIYTSGHVHVC